jgi:hypothetical protein
VVEGEHPDPQYCIPLGKCVIRDLPPGLPRGARVQVEYRYASNGRISISARVPAVRQSAHVEIERERSEDLHDLAAWRKRLCGRLADVSAVGSDGPPEPLIEGAPLGSADRSAVIKRLDDLYVQVGLGAARVPLPPQFERSKQHALSLARELRRAKTALEQAEAARQSAANEQEAVRLAAQVSEARVAVQHAETQTRFGYLVLGRECIAANFLPPELDRHLPEIRRLQERLSRST